MLTKDLTKSKKYLVILFMAIGILARGLFLGSFPAGINQDEAFAAYDAYSLLHWGIDSSGYPFPVYLNSWGSGMNALNTYLMLPFIAVFGLKTWVIRLPQFIVSCFSLYVFYKLLQKLLGEEGALIGLFYFAVCPWHIMMSRWGLESNLAPGFLLFGLYFFILGSEKSKYFMLSALFYGLSLYCYATIWPIVPFILLFQFIYLYYTKKVHFDKNLIYSVLIIGLLALPLILFMLVNYGLINEIKTGFLSIPKLSIMRKSDITFSYITWYLRNLIIMLFRQNDGLYWNSTDEFGIYYKGFLIFGIIGGIIGSIKVCSCIKNREYNGFALVFIQLFFSAVLGCLISVNVNRINCIHIPIIIFIAAGMYYLLSFLGKKFKSSYVIAGIALFLCFGSFEYFYFTEYSEKINGLWQNGLDSCVEYAMELSDGDSKIYVSKDFSYAKILFYSKEPVKEYIDTVVYSDESSSALMACTFGQFVFDTSRAGPHDICIISSSEADSFEERGFETVRFKHCAVAY